MNNSYSVRVGALGTGGKEKKNLERQSLRSQIKEADIILRLMGHNQIYI